MRRAAAVIVMLGGLVAASEAAEPRTVVEELIAAQNPCQRLRTKQFGLTIGIDRLEDVRLDTATIRLDGDRVSLDFAGRLACTTAPGAGLSGDAAATVEAAAALSLADCTIDTLDVRLSDFAGSFGPILAALAPVVEAELRAAAEPRLREACREFRGRSG